MSENRPERRPGQKATASLTRDAYERLRAEMDQLTTEGRALMGERLERAREHGDIRENAEYDAAKNEQGMMEARIRTLQRMLADPDIVEGPANAEEAQPGLLVVVRPVDDDDDDEERYLLASSKEERHAGARTVSVDSPFGKALLGRRPGEKVAYQAPGGTFTYEILRLEHR